MLFSKNESFYAILKFSVQILIQVCNPQQKIIKLNMISKKYRNLLSMMVPKRKKIIHTSYHKMPHYIYNEEAMDSVKIEHIEPKGIKDTIAFKCIQIIRRSYDFLTRYDPQKMTVSKWVQRCLILETVAGVPGMVGGMARHLRSLRLMQRDGGWIHHLFQEADNERFHLFVFLNLKQPKIMERIFIILLQGIFFNSFFVAYLMSPKFCHRFVGYLEEEAVKTYTAMLKEINTPDSVLYHWNFIPAPKEAIDYYQLESSASYRDVINCIRADQATHRGTNHYLADLNQDDQLQEEPIQAINKTVKEVQEMEAKNCKRGGVKTLESINNTAEKNQF